MPTASISMVCIATTSLFLKPLKMNYNNKNDKNKDHKGYTIKKDKEGDIYTTNDAYRKYYNGLPSDYIVVP